MPEERTVGCVMEDLGTAIELVVAGAHKQVQKIAPDADANEVALNIVFELLCVAHNCATKAQILEVLETRIRD